jgi:hypothetical protein
MSDAASNNPANFACGSKTMLDRLSVNSILRSVIAALGAVVVIMLAAGAWSSWGRLQVDNRIAGVAAASAHVFTALHNLRSDRARSYRMLMGDEVVTARDPRLWESRDAEMPALKGALATLETLDFPERQAVTAELAQRIKKLAAARGVGGGHAAAQGGTSRGARAGDS